MYLYFIRHAQSANNELYARTGGSDGRSADPPLTELGHRQARHLAQHLSSMPPNAAAEPGFYAARHDRGGFGLTHLYCSLMTRAVQTADYIARATGLAATGWVEIHERGGLHAIDPVTGEDCGVSGPNRAWFTAEYPWLVLPESVGEQGWWNRERESNIDSIPRARLVWEQLLARHGGDDRVAIVSHGGFFQSFLTVLLTPSDHLSAPHLGVEEWWFGISNASISRIEIGGGLAVVRYLNRVDFLPDDLISG